MKGRIQHKPTILQVVPSLNSGGVERGTVEISEAIVKAGMKSIVISNGGTLASRIMDQGGKHILLDVSTKNPIKIYRNIKKIKQVIIENEVDLVHARSRAPAWSCFKACSELNIPFITTFHGSYSQNFFKKHYNKVMTLGKVVIAVSDYISEYINKHFPKAKDKIIIIHRGVDTEHFNATKIPPQRLENAIINLNIKNIQDPKHRNKPIIVLPARITRWKGQNLFIEALAKLENKEFHAVILGDTKHHERYYKELNELVIKNDLSKQVNFASHLHDMPAVYAVSDIIIVPSLRPEAFGRVVIEAQSMEKIVIASNIGGARETIIDKETGFLFEPGSVESLAKTLEEVLHMSKDEKDRIRKNAREHVIENFSLEKMRFMTIQVYRQILNV
ncbi:MAG: glycosyltransferase family 4 protein [Sphingobacteriia bacterium]|nr:glycosyltransferase family 4 protein [Sphingobacteriia bacterium]